jgi:ribosomal protein S18 acetylase RimI-like enzyme
MSTSSLTGTVAIRRAEKSDCPRLLELVYELAHFERAPEQVTVSLDHFTQSGFGLQTPLWWAFVAELSTDSGQKQILGFALYYIRYSTWKGQRMYLEDIIVTNAARGMGIGAKLMDRLIQEAKEKKFSGIAWQVLDWNEAAIGFYKKFPTHFDQEWINCSIELHPFSNPTETAKANQ